MTRPITTLFLLQSLDGKISTGSTDNRDVDKDIPSIPGDPSAGLQQYKDAELETDLWSLNSGRVMAKIGGNNNSLDNVSRVEMVSFVIIDNNYLTSNGVRYFSLRFGKLVIITSNPNHPAFKVKDEYANIIIIKYSGSLNPVWMLKELYKLGCEQLTIQTGGTLNQLFLKYHLIDKVNVVIWPALVGGKNVSTLIDGDDPKTLSDIGILKLTECKVLRNSYIELFYDVVNSK